MKKLSDKVEAEKVLEENQKSEKRFKDGNDCGSIYCQSCCCDDIYKLNQLVMKETFIRNKITGKYNDGKNIGTISKK